MWLSQRERARRHRRRGGTRAGGIIYSHRARAPRESSPRRQGERLRRSRVTAQTTSLGLQTPGSIPPACHEGLVNAKHTEPSRPGSGPGIPRLGPTTMTQDKESQARHFGGGRRGATRAPCRGERSIREATAGKVPRCHG